MKKLIVGLKLAYHGFVEGFRSEKYNNLVKSSPTNAHIVQNASRLEKACENLMPHIQRIIDLTPSDSEKHQSATKRLDAVRETYKTARQYKNIGDVAERVLGRRT